MDQPSMAPQTDTSQTTADTLASEHSVQETEGKPDHVPDKFWDSDQGSIRTDILLKSYGELERRLGDTNAHIPDTPDAYEITMPSEQIKPDVDVNARLHAAGFTQKQTQLVYDLAYEKLAPLIEETANELHQESSVARLESHFGGKAKWQETSRQLKLWGETNLPSEAFDNLSASVDGILAMHRMMQTSEPSMMGNQAVAQGGLGENDLKQMMKNPRYWRDQDPSFVEQVRKGFQTLYPD